MERTGIDTAEAAGTKGGAQPMMDAGGGRRLKVVFFAQRFPFPMDTGGKIRTGKILEQLRREFDVTLITNVESPKDDPYLPEVRNLCSDFRAVPWKEIPKYSLRFWLRLLVKSLSRIPIAVSNDYSKDLERTLLETLQEKKPDLLVCDFLQPSINCRKVRGIRTLLFQHNVEAVLPQRHYRIAKNPLSRLFWWLQWKRMERYEREACHRFDGIIAVSDTDRRTMEEQYGARNVRTIPTGVDTEFFTPQGTPALENSLVFTGSMDWLPNEDALLHFAGDILPRVKEKVPGVRLTVVGRNPSRTLRQKLAEHPEIEVVGRVPDVRPYMDSHSVYVIPLRIGGGTRIKAYEALSMGKAMVSTSVGVEGLPVRHGEHLLIADGAPAFADAVVSLLGDAKRRAALGAAARAYVKERFGWSEVARVFSGICRDVANAAPSR